MLIGVVKSLPFIFSFCPLFENRKDYLRYEFVYEHFSFLLDIFAVFFVFFRLFSNNYVELRIYGSQVATLLDPILKLRRIKLILGHKHLKKSSSFLWYYNLISLIKGHARLFFSRKKSSLPSDFHVID